MQAGPRANLDEFVDAMQRLEKSIAFFEQNECAFPAVAALIVHSCHCCERFQTFQVNSQDH